MTTNPKTIPEQVRQQADDIIQQFNESVIRNPDRYFVPRYRGRFLYLDRLYRLNNSGQGLPWTEAHLAAQGVVG